MNDSELCRHAATLMRERAEKTTWEHRWTAPDIYMWACDGGMVTQADQEDAEHIAGWDPGVALEVANYLEAAAGVLETFGVPVPVHARRIARAYLREPL